MALGDEGYHLAYHDGDLLLAADQDLEYYRQLDYPYAPGIRPRW